MPLALKTYRLCRKCAERQGNATAFELVQAWECFVCAGMMDRAGKMADMAIRRARRYQFRSFTVGISVPADVMEREDEMRSEMKLKGNETIKTQTARMVASQLSKELRKRVDRQRPDATLLVDFGSNDVIVASRPVYFYGRYTKPPSVSQRRSFCEHCRGTGCGRCRNTGFRQTQSVEETLRRKLARFSGSQKMTFTWLGSEDRESRVYPPGRPFVVEVKSPRKRALPKKFGARLRGGLVSVSSGRVLPSKPLRMPSFRFFTKIKATARSKVTPEGIAELESRFHETAVRFERPNNRPVVKTVYSVSAKTKGRALLIVAELDGGLPVKRFVSGELVSPSVSEVLKTEVGCRSFDICGVRETGRFEFAEIARGEEKN